MSYGISPYGLPCVITTARMGHHSVTERFKTGSASDLVEVESHDFNRGSVSRSLLYNDFEQAAELGCLLSFLFPAQKLHNSSVA